LNILVKVLDQILPANDAEGSEDYAYATGDGDGYEYYADGGYGGIGELTFYAKRKGIDHTPVVIGSSQGERRANVRNQPTSTDIDKATIAKTVIESKAGSGASLTAKERLDLNTANRILRRAAATR